VSIPDRRTVLRSGLAAALGAVGAVAGCTARAASPAASPVRRHLIGPHSPQVAAAEAARRAAGTTLAGVAPQAGHIDLGGPIVATWSYGGQVPGPEIRVRKGQTLQALLVNGLPVETTVHWHGVAIRNDMDGVPGMTQAPVPANREYTYSFAVTEPGTYWYHPHVGVQLDRGLYGPLIVEDPSSLPITTMTGPSSSTTGSTAPATPLIRSWPPCATAWAACRWRPRPRPRRR
jgi:FtsP/CotA-like multicopper oxidase with cupredoxin domain